MADDPGGPHQGEDMTAEDVITALRAAGCVFAEEEADILSHAAADESSLVAMVAERAAGAPLEHVVGQVEFLGMHLRVGPGVFVPRQRTRLLARAAVEALYEEVGGGAPSTAVGGPTPPSASRPALQTAVEAGRLEPDSSPIFVEAFCGAAPIAAHVRSRVPGTRVHAIDSDATALGYARVNLRGDLGPTRVERFGPSRHVQRSMSAMPGSGHGGVSALGPLAAGAVHVGSVLNGLPAELTGHIAVIAAVPPYVPDAEVEFLPREARDAEPTIALLGGVDGLVPARLLIREAAEWLRPCGRLLLEMNLEQIPSAEGFARQEGYTTNHHAGDDGQTAILDLQTPTLDPPNR